MSVLAKLRQAFNIIVGARNALIDKGETVEYDDDIPQIIEDMDTGGGADTETLLKLIERPRTSTSINIPEGTTKIGEYAFYNYSGVTSISIPSSVAEIGQYALAGVGITDINIPSTVEYIGDSACSNCANLLTATISSNKTGASMFLSCSHLTRITISSSVTVIDDRLAASCYNLTTIYIPNSITRIVSGFGLTYNCTALEYVTIETGFNANGLDLASSGSTKFSVDTIISWLNALADRTGQTAYTLRIGSTNLAKLSAAEIAIATNKNWNLA